MQKMTVRINAGGRLFETLLSTVCKYPETPLAKLFKGHVASSSSANSRGPLKRKGSGGLGKKVSREGAPQTAPSEVFIDVNPLVFEHVLDFLRTGDVSLPVSDEKLRRGVVHQLDAWQLMEHAFPPVARVNESSEGVPPEGALPAGYVRLPDVCVVQMCDHMQHDQGVKRHALTITYGSDGFLLKSLCKAIRGDLSTQLASTYWQCYQTNERSAFFVTTKVANGTADLMTTAISQQVIQHTESMGYSLVSSYVTLSPDVVHTSVRMLIHNLIFRRIRQPSLEDTDALAVVASSSSSALEEVVDDLVMPNFQPPSVGPQKVSNLWK
jgi:hypothetical protein